jgi:tetratricopeptide (TPR) repeat protein
MYSMNKSWVAMACALVLLLQSAAGARGQNNQELGPKVGEYGPDVEAKEWILLQEGDEVPSLSQLRGLVVVLVFWVSWHDGGEIVMPYVTLLAEGGAQQGVFTIGLTDADRKTTEPLIRKSKAFFPVGTRSQAAEQYGFPNGWGLVIIDAEGKIAFKGQPQNLDEWQRQVQDIFSKTPATRVHPNEARAIVKRLDMMKAKIRDMKYRDTMMDIYECLTRLVTGDKLGTELVEVYDIMNQIGYERLSKVNVLLEQDKYREAADVLRVVARRFRGLPPGRDARDKIDKLSKSNDQFKAAMEAYSDEDKAYKLFLEARGEISQKQVGEGWKLLDECMTKYPNTEAAEQAKAMVERMKANPVVWGHVLDMQARADCEQWLVDGRNLARAGKPAEARKVFDRIMKQYPDSKYAEQAQAEAAKLP